MHFRDDVSKRILIVNSRDKGVPDRNPLISPYAAICQNSEGHGIFVDMCPTRMPVFGCELHPLIELAAHC